MIRVQGGTFEMGGKFDVREKPVHTVKVSDFELAQFPVTQALWEAVMGEGSNPSHLEGPRRPVEQVSWYDAVAFCNQLNHLEKLPYCYFSDEPCTQPYALVRKLPYTDTVYFKPAHCAFRLPTEAEWEYAARGGSCQTKTRYTGSSRVNDSAWFNQNSGEETHPVGLMQPNALGLYDMSGNVWEWCWDYWHNYPNSEEKNSTLRPDSEITRIVRGGSWTHNDTFCEVSRRAADKMDNFDNFIGFRLARHLSL